jgi:small subunit ribosomal protein S17
MAHDEANDANIGDEVALVLARPLSRRKRWVVTRVVNRARVV